MSPADGAENRGRESSPTTSSSASPDKVQEYFDGESSYWREIYQGTGVRSRIYQRRTEYTLEWIRQLQLAPGERCLEVGCGAGVLSAALAAEGFRVDAIDLAPTMVKLAREEAERRGVAARVATSLGDVHELQFPDQSFGVVVALGVLPWVPDPERALAEMTRVLRPGGYLLVSVDNRWRLNHLLDPLLTPVLAKLRRPVRRVLETLHLLSRTAPNGARYQSPPECKAALEAAGTKILRCASIGFGPFSFMNFKLMKNGLSVSLDRRLQALADQGTEPWNSTGVHYVALASKK